MSVKSDKWIRRMARDRAMIEPFEPGLVREVGGRRVVSFGTSSYGYDIRCSNEFKLFTNLNSTIVDPKNFDEKSFVDVKGDHCVIPPNSFALARTLEYFRIPRDVLEFSNTTPLPAKIYANEGVAQIIFLGADEVCETSYRDRGGKYQGQKGVTLPRI
jgi:dCTP deaminase